MAFSNAAEFLPSKIAKQLGWMGTMKYACLARKGSTSLRTKKGAKFANKSLWKIADLVRLLQKINSSAQIVNQGCITKKMSV